MDRSISGILLRAAQGWFLLTLCALTLMPQRAGAQSTECKAQAAFLIRLIPFIQWPSSNDVERTPFYIGILGNNPFGDDLDQLIKGQKVDGHPVVLKYSHHVDDLENCRIVFINKAERFRMARILNTLNGRSALTVSDYSGFARNGGIINLYLKDGKVHFDINAHAAKQNRLKISSQLIRMGNIVQGPPQRR